MYLHSLGIEKSNYPSLGARKILFGLGLVVVFFAPSSFSLEPMITDTSTYKLKIRSRHLRCWLHLFLWFFVRGSAGAGVVLSISSKHVQPCAPAEPACSRARSPMPASTPSTMGKHDLGIRPGSEARCRFGQLPWCAQKQVHSYNEVPESCRRDSYANVPNYEC